MLSTLSNVKCSIFLFQIPVIKLFVVLEICWDFSAVKQMKKFQVVLIIIYKGNRLLCCYFTGPDHL